MSIPQFSVVTAHDVHNAIFANIHEVLDVVRQAYIAHHQGATVNPPSSFLRFAERPKDRIIALPAHVRQTTGPAMTGIKWIASFPGNIENGIPRASAVIVLNDPANGYPLACLEGSIISAARTAASAALAASAIAGDNRTVKSIGVIGCGVIASYIIDFLLATGWSAAELHVHDLSRAHAQNFVSALATTRLGKPQIQATADEVLSSSDLVVFATTSGVPYLHNVAALAHNPLILHISLRDLAPELILTAHNVVDDVDHCLTAGTSAHLAEQLSGNRDFVRFTLPALLTGSAPPDRLRPIVFSPFGMGILDIALAQWTLDKATANGQLTCIPDFFQGVGRSGAQPAAA